MKHLALTFFLLTSFYPVYAQDVVIEATENEDIILDFSGFEDETAPKITFTQTSGGTYNHTDFDASTGKMTFNFSADDVYDFDFFQESGDCKSTTSVRFVVKAKSEPIPENPAPQNSEISLIVPNIFTPDNNGVNDYFHVKYSEKPQQFAIRIYDRNGKEVFSSTDPDFKWDGSNCNPGTYFYIVNYRDVKSDKTQSGSLSMLNKKR